MMSVTEDYITLEINEIFYLVDFLEESCSYCNPAITEFCDIL